MDAGLQQILPLLQCPSHGGPLRAATEAETARLNAAIAAGTLANVGGAKVEEALTEALVSESGDLAYAVRDGIPILLVEDGLPLESDRS